jgi:uncharacterized repeat protein (TIGR03803 family)
MRSKNSFSAGKPTFVIFTALLLAFAIVPTQAGAQTFKVLHTFHGRDGASPEGLLVRDAAGNLYGTTIGGGTGKCSKFGCGTAFKLTKVGRQVWLHSFQGGNGYDPVAGLLRDAAGGLYGTTGFGGKVTNACGGVQAGGCGVAFKLDKTGKETVLHRFAGPPGGYAPYGLLARDGAGDLYGITAYGGADLQGTVFGIDAAGTETTLHSFAGPPEGGGDGSGPEGGVVRDASGNLYGVTFSGGAYGAGSVYEVDSRGNETLLYSFNGSSDGAQPSSALLLDPQGNLYGTTQNGGNGECGGTGCGVVFELSPQSGGGWSEKLLYVFCSLSGCIDGEEPGVGPLVRDSAGNLYGTTYFGGTSGEGVVFKLDTTGKETVLHSFTGGADGANPVVGLAIDRSGNLYGTTQAGGASCFTRYTCGVVFKVAGPPLRSL